MTEIQVRPKTDKRIAWQYCGDEWAAWPEWVKNCCNPIFNSKELVLRRKSGAQRVRLTDWLIKDLDGGIIWCRDADMWNEWEKV